MQVLRLTLVWVLVSACTRQGSLLEEHLTQPGAAYVVEGYGDLGNAKQAQLVCSYQGRGRVIRIVYWYAANGMFGRAQCPSKLEQE